MMREILPAVTVWLAEGKQVAVATVVKVYGSAPRPLGAKMAVSSAGDMVGSVSGGCVEGNVFELAQLVIKNGKAQLVEYGIADELAFEVVGLACGGNIEIYIEPVTINSLFESMKSKIENQQLISVATVIGGTVWGAKRLIPAHGDALGNLEHARLNAEVDSVAQALMQSQQTARQSFEIENVTADVFIEVFSPLPRLIVVGAVHIAMTLVAFGKALGFRTVVIDPRATFASSERFPNVDEMILEWPADALQNLRLDESSYVVFVTHDAKFDNPALVVSLNSPARYIGALGSRRTHAKRVTALQALGVPNEKINRIHAPIGLDIGARGPQEIALSVISEIIAVKRGKVD